MPKLKISIISPIFIFLFLFFLGGGEKTEQVSIDATVELSLVNISQDLSASPVADPEGVHLNPLPATHF